MSVAIGYEPKGKPKIIFSLVENEDGKSTIRRYGESVANDAYVQEQLNCYDPWAPDLPDDQPVRTIENSQRAAFYRFLVKIL